MASQSWEPNMKHPKLISLPKSQYTKEDFEKCLLSEEEEEHLLSVEEILLSDCYDEFHKYGGE